jgi:beta-N-acetylhexosaminidase
MTGTVTSGGVAASSPAPSPSAAELSRQVLSTLMPGFVGTTPPAWVEARLEQGLGAVCLFGPNVASRSQLAALTASLARANPDVVIAIDEEGGDVTRVHHLEGSPYPGNAILGRLDDLDYTFAVAHRVGEELAETGCTLTFAPDVDVNSNPLNPVIGVRSFGADEALVARHSAAWTRGVQAAGVAACAKHFPGHGDTSSDSHLALPVIDVDAATLRSRELEPFRAAVDAGTLTVMTSHILVPAIDPGNPATFSAPILEGILRGELGFEGVIVSDALDMVGASGEIGIPEAAVRALAAGCDLLCIGTDNSDAEIGEILDHVLRAVEEGRLSVERVAEASRRVAWLAERTAEARVSAGDASVAAGLSDVSSEAATSPGTGTATDATSTRLGTAEERARVRSVFDVNDRAARGLARTRGGESFTVVTVESVANIAVGASPWGPFAAAGFAAESTSAADLVSASDPASAADPAPTFPSDPAFAADSAPAPASDSAATLERAQRFAAAPAATIPEQGSFDASPIGAGVVLVVGKDIHRRAAAVAAIDALRADRGDDVVVIDMGWPDPTLSYADVATWGASRLAGDALLDLIVGEPA